MLKNALWLDVENHMTSVNQSEFFISAQFIYSTLNLVYDTGSTLKLRYAGYEQFGWLFNF